MDTGIDKDVGPLMQFTKELLLSTALLRSWDGLFFSVEDCPVLCRLFSSILDIYLLNACTSLVVPIKNVFRVSNVPEGCWQNCLHLRNSVPK